MSDVADWLECVRSGRWVFVYAASGRLDDVFLILLVGWKVYLAADKLICVCLMLLVS